MRLTRPTALMSKPGMPGGGVVIRIMWRALLLRNRQLESFGNNMCIAARESTVFGLVYQLSLK